MNRKEAESLLPWYVAGALSEEERKAVEVFIDSGEISAADLEKIRFVGNALAETGAGGTRYDPQILERVLKRLDDTPQDAANAEEPLVVVRERAQPHAAAGGWLATLLDRLQWSITPPLARAAIVAQLALLLGVAVAFTLRDESVRESNYEVVPGPVAGDYTLTFAPGVTEAQVRALLLKERARIVSGPSAIGLYTVALDGGLDGDAAAQRIEASGLVTFLQPAPRP